MLRTISIILALAAFALSPANASPLHRMKLHRSVHATVASHNSKKNARPAAEGRAGHARIQRARYELPQEKRRTAGRVASGRRQAALQTASLRLPEPEMPPPLRGSRESLERQNDKTEADGLERIEDEDDLADRIARKMLVRTVDYQKRLMGINGNAAPAEGDVASPHLTGASIDLAKLGMTRQEIVWMRSWLLPLQQAGKIDVEEEFQQSCFHITVYKVYLPPAPVQADGHEKPGRGNRSSGNRSGVIRPSGGGRFATLLTGMPPSILCLRMNGLSN